MKRNRILAQLATALACTSAAASAQTTTRVNVDSAGVQANASAWVPSLSADGRYVAFYSTASNLVANDTNAVEDVFVHDRQTATTVRVSVDAGGAQANAASTIASLSGDGRYVAFESEATNLVAGDTNGFADVFVVDRQTGVVVRANVDSVGTQADNYSGLPSISADGRYVAFYSLSALLAPGDGNTHPDVFRHDLQTGTTVSVSVTPGGSTGNQTSAGRPSISADGRYIAFFSVASDLVPGDTNPFSDIFVRDLQAGTTVLASVSSGGASAGSPCVGPSLSADGRYVAFDSTSCSLVADTSCTVPDVFVRDLQTNTTTKVSVDSNGLPQASASSVNAGISGDGRYVAFETSAAFAADDTGGTGDVYVKDRQTGVATRASRNSAGVQGNSTSGFFTVTMSGDGTTVAFESTATNLVAADTNGAMDVFVRERDNTWSFTTFCFPGENGVIPCPCGNPPTSQGHGCDNFGGAPVDSCRLSATGDSQLSNDTVVLTSSGENNTSLTIFLQSPTSSPTGAVFGGGVRCLTGTLRRLYTGSASAGSISRPGGGDLSIHDRSAALGATIPSGATRYYMTYYRDPNAAIACSNAASTFNSSQGGFMAWAP